MADKPNVSADPSEPSFYTLGDDDLNTRVTAAPLRTSNGRLDIGGRLRVAAILKHAGIVTDEPPERIAGSTNEVYRAGDYIVRVGFIPGADRLRREARLAELLPYDVHYPKVVASGTESFGEWIIVRHRPGLTLSHAWSDMDDVARKSALQDVAFALKAVHGIHLDAQDAQQLAFKEGPGLLALPHQFPAERLLQMLESLKSRQYLDGGLISEAEERIRSIAHVFDPLERNGLVHGDLHFENVLVKDGVIVALLDFEWSRTGPKEIDIDVLARFCAHPQLHVGGNYRVNQADYRKVLPWMHEMYPELFGHEYVRERLLLCALAFEIPSLVEAPVRAPASELSQFHPVNRLRDLLDQGTYAERLGWDMPAW